MITSLHRILPPKENPGSNEVSVFSCPMNFNENMIFTLAVKSAKVFLPVHISRTFGMKCSRLRKSTIRKVKYFIVYSLLHYLIFFTPALELSS